MYHLCIEVRILSDCDIFWSLPTFCFTFLAPIIHVPDNIAYFLFKWASRVTIGKYQNRNVGLQTNAKPIVIIELYGRFQKALESGL